MSRIAQAAVMASLVMPIGSMARPEPSPMITGFLSQYAQRPTDATLAARIAWGHIPADLSPYPVRLAVLDCSLIGATGTIWAYNQEPQRFVVFDCSGHAHTSEWMRRANIIGEVDYHTAVRWGVVGVGGIPGAVRYD